MVARARGPHHSRSPSPPPLALMLVLVVVVQQLAATGFAAVPGPLRGGVPLGRSVGRSTLSLSATPTATLQRMRCIAHTHPVFDPSRCEDGWDCKVYLPKSEEGPQCRCCMEELSVAQTKLLLNGTTAVFAGDSTARRAARQLKAFLEGSEFRDWTQHTDSATHLEDPVAGTGLDIRTYWLPSVEDFTIAVDTRGPALFTRDIPTTSPVILVHAASTHDLIRNMWRWTLEARAAKNASLPPPPRTVPAGNIRETAARLAELLGRVHDNLRQDTDMLIVRLPIVQACNATKYSNLCKNATAPSGAVYSLTDPFNDDLVDLFTVSLRQEVGRRLLLSAATLPMSWTGAPDVAVDGERHRGANRHPCTPADAEGTHFGTVRGRMAFVQQVLHAAVLMARDRAGWAHRAWTLARAGNKEVLDNVCS